MNPFPAIMIGGPPHSGKSVLTYRLTQALRERGIDHYVLRACPDGEGDWSQEAPPRTVRILRAAAKGPFTPEFVRNVCRDIQSRHLPLLVDVGGRPTPDQESILEHCTHAILISRDPAQLPIWRERAHRYGLVVLAELRSSLDEPEALWEEGPPLGGRIHGLAREVRTLPKPDQAPVFWALVDRIQDLFVPAAQGARSYHLEHAPVDLAVDVEELLQAFKPGMVRSARRWSPDDLPAFLDYLPRGEPLALYGRMPVWIAAAAAAWSWPAPFYQFDVRLGWVEPLTIRPATTSHLAHFPNLVWRATLEGKSATLRWSLAGSYLDYHACRTEELQGPSLPLDRGVILSGKGPLWLYTGLVRAYHAWPWVAVAYPPEGIGVVVHSRDPEMPVGSTISLNLRRNA